MAILLKKQNQFKVQKEAKEEKGGSLEWAIISYILEVAFIRCDL